jgi:hypothetical protein
VPYEPAYAEVFMAALNEAIALTADCHPVADPSDHTLLSVRICAVSRCSSVQNESEGLSTFRIG